MQGRGLQAEPRSGDAARLVHREVGTGRHQHLLGVGPGADLLPHHRLALGAEAGEQDRRLHLGAGHRHGVVDAVEVAAVDDQGRQAASVPAVDAGAHQPQRPGHPVHRPAGDGLVAGQHGHPVERGAQAGQQPDGGARVADVDDAVGLVQAAPAAGDQVARRRPPRGPRPRRGADHVVARRQPPHDRRALGQRPQHQGPVGDGLVARHPHRAPQRPAASMVKAVTRAPGPRPEAPVGEGRPHAVGRLLADDHHQHALGPLDRVGDLQVLDVDVQLAQQRGDLGQHPRAVGHRHPDLGQLLGHRTPGRAG